MQTPADTKDITVTVKQIRFMTLNGESYIYLKDENNVLYKMEVSEDESVLLIEENAKIDITYSDTDVNEKIKQIVSWKFSEVTQ